MLKEFLEYLWKNKIWWLAPSGIVIVIVGALMFFMGGSQISPFIYMFF